MDHDLALPLALGDSNSKKMNLDHDLAFTSELYSHSSSDLDESRDKVPHPQDPHPPKRQSQGGTLSMRTYKSLPTLGTGAGTSNKSVSLTRPSTSSRNLNSQTSVRMSSSNYREEDYFMDEIETENLEDVFLDKRTCAICGLGSTRKLPLNPPCLCEECSVWFVHSTCLVKFMATNDRSCLNLCPCSKRKREEKQVSKSLSTSPQPPFNNSKESKEGEPGFWGNVAAMVSYPTKSEKSEKNRKNGDRRESLINRSINSPKFFRTKSNSLTDLGLEIDKFNSNYNTDVNNGEPLRTSSSPSSPHSSPPSRRSLANLQNHSSLVGSTGFTGLSNSRRSLGASNGEWSKFVNSQNSTATGKGSPNSRRKYQPTLQGTITEKPVILQSVSVNYSGDSPTVSAPQLSRSNSTRSSSRSPSVPNRTSTGNNLRSTFCVSSSPKSSPALSPTIDMTNRVNLFTTHQQRQQQHHTSRGNSDIDDELCLPEPTLNSLSDSDALAAMPSIRDVNGNFDMRQVRSQSALTIIKNSQRSTYPSSNARQLRSNLTLNDAGVRQKSEPKNTSIEYNERDHFEQLQLLKQSKSRPPPLLPRGESQKIPSSSQGLPYMETPPPSSSSSTSSTITNQQTNQPKETTSSSPCRYYKIEEMNLMSVQELKVHLEKLELELVKISNELVVALADTDTLQTRVATKTRKSKQLCAVLVNAQF